MISIDQTIARLRAMGDDWPPVRMSDITALIDEIERLRIGAAPNADSPNRYAQAGGAILNARREPGCNSRGTTLEERVSAIERVLGIDK